MKLSTLITPAVALFVFFLTCAHADEYPQRKEGLWKVTTSMSMMGKELSQTSSQCIDSETDRVMLEGPSSPQSGIQCDKPLFSKKGADFHSETVCNGNGMKVITTAVFSGDFSSEYSGDLVTRQEPPMEGFPQQKIKLVAKWLGPCKAGQKPGDMILSDGTTVNILANTAPPARQEGQSGNG